ncbi:CxC2 domain-containing protein [Favolaschia claudopus]|uniref:CxC2 domain-containing protein n=1 Tax=Favolaschia claudopus TaxID=2862362 RepID=A0AAW0DGI7_9AGAR
MSSAQARQSHKRQAVLPQLVVSHTASQESFRSADNRRQRTRIGTVADTAAPSRLEDLGAWHQEDLATSRAREDLDFTYQLGALLAEEPDLAVPDGINVVSAETRPSSERPLRAWYPLRDEYVAELLRRDGRGSPKVYERCAGGHGRCEGSADFRWANEQCFGEAMYCQECIHWSGTYFERTTLKALGLRMQLNHRSGVVCPYRRAVPNDFTLYDLSGVHEIAVDYCGCRTEDGSEEGGEPLAPRTQLLRACWWPATIWEPRTCATFSVMRLFQVLNCLGKLSAYDFLRGLEMK